VAYVATSETLVAIALAVLLLLMLRGAGCWHFSELGHEDDLVLSTVVA
jgi:hypothetical protein